MGLLISKLFEIFSTFKGNSARILMIGLDAAGKTTILYQIKLNENVCTIPTIGFNVETVSPCPGITFTVWDVGGQTKIRPLWRHYFQNTNGLVYVVDSSDKERIYESREELQHVLEEDEMRGIPVVCIANKQDLPGAMNPSQVAEALGLTKVKDRKWHVQGTCAVSGDGLCESMIEMARLVKEFQKQKSFNF